MERILLQALIGLLLALPARSQTTDLQAINYVKSAWEITDLTDEVISQTLNTSYSGIPYKDYVSFYFVAPDILTPLQYGDYKIAGKKAADFAAEQFISNLLKQTGFSSVAASVSPSVMGDPSQSSGATRHGYRESSQTHCADLGCDSRP